MKIYVNISFDNTPFSMKESRLLWSKQKSKEGKNRAQERLGAWHTLKSRLSISILRKVFTNVVILIIQLVNQQFVAFSDGPQKYGNVYCRYSRN